MRAFQGCAELKSHPAARSRVYLRALPEPGRGDIARPLTEPVLTMRAAQLSLDGDVRDPTGDLEAGRLLRLTDDEALDRQPEGLIVLTRLPARFELEVTESTLASAIAARRGGAPRRRRTLHIGVVLRDLLDCPEAADALAWLEDLAPDVPLHEGVKVDAVRSGRHRPSPATAATTPSFKRSRRAWPANAGGRSPTAQGSN